MPDHCFNDSELVVIPSDHPHLKNCPRCRKKMETLEPLRRIWHKETQRLQPFRELIEEEDTVKASINDLKELPREERLQTLKRWKKPTLSFILACIRQAYGNLHRDPRECQVWLQGAYKMFRRVHEKGEDFLWVQGKYYLNLGSLKGLQGRLRECEKAYQKALALFQKLGDDYQVGKTLMGLAYVLVKKGLFRQALHVSLEALSIFKAYNDENFRLYLFNDIALIYWAMRRNLRAEAILDAILKFVKPSDRFFSMIMSNKALIALEKEDPLHALSLVDQALRWALESDDSYEIARLSRQKSYILMKLGQYLAALFLLDRVIEGFQKLGCYYDELISYLYRAMATIGYTKSPDAYMELYRLRGFFAEIGMDKAFLVLLDRWTRQGEGGYEKESVFFTFDKVLRYFQYAPLPS